MNVRVLFFAAYRDRAGQSDWQLDIPPGSRLQDVLRRVRAAFPKLAPAGHPLVAAVNKEYATDDDLVLHDGDEVALLPPVSGGAPPVRRRASGLVVLTDRRIQPAPLVRRVHRDVDGAVVTFAGTTRRFTEGREVLHLDYEHYPGMAERTLAQVRTEALARFPVHEIAIAHRVGRVDLGETSLLVVVGSAHREEAFAAAAWIVDRIKQIVPIWKREVFTDGSVWVGADGEFPPGAPAAHGAVASSPASPAG